MNIINKVTLMGLKKNKVRTIVTIIGIILSVAMITAVTTLISSVQNYLLDLSIETEGNWHTAVHEVSFEDFEKIKGMDEINNAAATRGIGYSALEGSINDLKPYLYLLELDHNAFEMLPIHLTQGRLPQNENEIVISEHINTNGGVKLEIGDKLDLSLGQRIADDGSILDQNNSYVLLEDGLSEMLEVNYIRTVTVVGEMRRFPFRLEDYSAPGYTIITALDTEELIRGGRQTENNISVYFTSENHRKIYETKAKVERTLGIGMDHFEDNRDVLMNMGISENDNFKAVLYSLGAILIMLIMIGSISLIYNSFSISVSERTKQFGLLSSVGATSKQIRHSVFFEALVLATIGIPLGVLAGIGGIGITLYFISDIFASFVNPVVYVPFTVSVSFISVIAAVLTALLTILISAHIPARRSSKVTAVEAIRQNADIKLKAKQVKTPRFFRRIIGIEGDFALKNLKRNRKGYRSTVLSLLISVVLFVSASAFSMYLRDSVNNVYENTDYDLYYYSTGNDKLDEKVSGVYKDILTLSCVKQGSVISRVNSETYLPKDKVTNFYYEKMLQRGITENDDLFVQVLVASVDQKNFNDYISSLGLKESQFEDPGQPTGIVVDSQHYYDYQAKKFMNTKVFRTTEIDSLLVEFADYDENEDRITSNQTEIKIAAFAETAPFGLSDYSENPGTIMVIVSEDTRSSLPSNLQGKFRYFNMYFAADDPSQAEADIRDILVGAGLPANIVNNATRMQANRNTITIISVFSYGFIILISLITIANVFNTISTNVSLRKREFAMLKSVGMTDRSFNKMMNFECILYGLKALLYGLPISILMTYLIYSSVGQGVEMGFYLPVNGILISVCSVFFVVFISMMYSMNKIRNENILDALKSETM